MKPTRLHVTALVLGLVLVGCAQPAPVRSTAAVIESLTAPAVASATSSAAGPSGLNTSSSPGASPVVPSTTPPPAVDTLAPAPRDCAPSAPLDTMTLREFGGGFSDGAVVLGRAPVWTVGLPDDGVLHLPTVSGSSDARFPNVKVMWIVGPNETMPVIVGGHERSTDGPLWFQVYPSNSAPGLPSMYTTSLRLDPATPNRGHAQNTSGDWSIWGIGVGARAAGCYSMTVSSSRGAWTIQLALGS